MRHTIGSSWRLRKLPTFCRVIEYLVVRDYPPINIKLEWHKKWETCFQLLKLKRQTNKQKISLVMSYKWQSGTKHDVSQPSTDRACFFCAEKKCLDSQFWSGTDRDVQSLSETLINTETRQEQVRNSPLLYHRVALANFIHQLKEKVRNMTVKIWRNMREY